MKIEIKIATAALLFACLSSIAVVPAAAATQQWFPSTGTKIEYAFTNYIRWKNGSIDFSNRFSVYNVSGTYMVVPSKLVALAPVTPFSSYLLYHDVPVTFTHEYLEKSSTEFTRTLQGTMGNVTLPKTSIFDLVKSCNNITYQYEQIANLNIVVGRTSFMSDMFLDFFDYIDNSAMPGQKITPYWTIISVTSDRIIAMTNHTAMANDTLVAGKDGKILSFTKASGGQLFNGQPNMAGAALTFEVISSTNILSGIFESPVEWMILIGACVGLLIVGLLIGHSGRKK